MSEKSHHTLETVKVSIGTGELSRQKGLGRWTVRQKRLRSFSPVLDFRRSKTLFYSYPKVVTTLILVGLLQSYYVSSRRC